MCAFEVDVMRELKYSYPADYKNLLFCKVCLVRLKFETQEFQTTSLYWGTTCNTSNTNHIIDYFDSFCLVHQIIICIAPVIFFFRHSILSSHVKIIIFQIKDFKQYAVNQVAAVCNAISIINL